jgi:hypothetical protein
MAVAALYLALPTACSLADDEGGLVTRVAAHPAAGAADFQRECSACHMAYPPQLLPARSWRALTGDLSHHFGEDASLDKPTTQRITEYLVANAADSPSGDRGVMQGLQPRETPIRITDMPFWRSIHPQLLARGVGTGPGIRSAANCLRCHGGGGEE